MEEFDKSGFRLHNRVNTHYLLETSWPWPIDSALRTMEAKLLEALRCAKGAEVLDAGCGVGHVALYMAQNGSLHVYCIDLNAASCHKSSMECPTCSSR